MPNALALMWDMLKDKELSDSDKYELLIDFDKVLGFNLALLESVKQDSKYIIKTLNEDNILVFTSDINVLPKDIQELINKREEYRKSKEWEMADKTRKEIEEKGWTIEDFSRKDNNKEKDLIKGQNFILICIVFKWPLWATSLENLIGG
jgi:cysteinyl-tRNA synthetase